MTTMKVHPRIGMKMTEIPCEEGVKVNLQGSPDAPIAIDYQYEHMNAETGNKERHIVGAIDLDGDGRVDELFRDVQVHKGADGALDRVWSNASSDSDFDGKMDTFEISSRGYRGERREYGLLLKDEDGDGRFEYKKRTISSLLLGERVERSSEEVADIDATRVFGAHREE